MRRSSVPLLLVPALLLHGCGGRTAGSASATNEGKAKISVAWPVPAAGRVIPLASNAILIQIKDASGSVKAHTTIVRPNAAWTSPSLAAGSYTLMATAYPTTGGTGNPDATGTGSVTIVANSTVPSSVTMGSTVTALAISPATLTPNVGDTTTLAASATDAAKAIVLVDPSTVHWTSSNPAVATVDATGLTPNVKAVAAGTATISAQFTEVEPSLNQTPVNATANVAVTVSTPVTLASSSWPKFRGDAANTGRGGGSGANGTTTKWMASYSAVASTGPSYLAIGQDGTLFLSTIDGKVTALNRATGTQLWSVTPGTANAAIPLAASSDGNVYALANTGTLFALNGATGAKMWTFAGGSSGVSTFTAGSDALTVGPDGTVYFANGDNTVYAVKGGKQVWSYKIGTTPSGGSTSSALALGANGDLYFCGSVGGGGFGGGTDSLYALKASTGTKLWSTSGVSGNPAVGDDGTVYLDGYLNGSGGGGFVKAFDGASGTQRWSSTINTGGGQLNLSVAIGRNGMVYVSNPAGAFGGGGTVALSASTGASVWTSAVAGGTSPVLASDGTVYVIQPGGFSTGGGGVTALDGTTGTTKWSYTPTGSGSPLGDDFAVDADGTLYATMSGSVGTGAPSGLFAFR